jgi:hypothetical protein
VIGLIILINTIHPFSLSPIDAKISAEVVMSLSNCPVRSNFYFLLCFVARG